MSRSVATYGENISVAPPVDVVRRFEIVFFSFVLFYSSGAIIQVAFLGNDPSLSFDENPGRAPLQMIWAGIYLLLFSFVFLFRNSLYGTVRQHPMLIALSFYVLASVSWSSVPEVTLQNSIVISLGTVIGIYVGTRFSTEQIFYLLKYPLLIGIVGSLVMVVVTPDLALMKGTYHDGLWRGAFTHKNGTGMISLISIIVFLFCFRHNVYMLIPLVGICTLLIIGARSSTSFIALAVLTAVYLLRRLLSVRGLDVFIVVIVGLLLSAIVGIILLLNLEAFFGLFGKDLTLTGRTILWEYGLTAFMSKPLLGYGFDAFWHDTSEYGGRAIRILAGWDVPGIHNGWLELLLSIGLVGTVLFGTVFFRLMQQCYFMMRTYPLSVHFYVMMFCIFMLVYSISEGVFLLRNSLMHVMLIAFVISTHREVNDHWFGQKQLAA